MPERVVGSRYETPSPVSTFAASIESNEADAAQITL